MKWKRVDISDDTVIEACIQYHESLKTIHAGPNQPPLFRPIEYIQQQTGAPEKVIVAAMFRALNREYIDYGTSIAGAFPTELGRKKYNE